jgi:SPOR domain/PilZ domain
LVFLLVVAFFGNDLHFPASTAPPIDLTSSRFQPSKRGEMAEERRQFQRVAVELPLPVLLDGAADGVVVDLCEGGFGVSELTARTAGDVIPFAFNLPEGPGRIRGKAQIAWKSEPGNRTGLQFVELSDPSREQLLRWLSTRAWTMRLDGMERECPEPPVAVGDATAPQLPIHAADAAPKREPRETNDAWALPPIPSALGAKFDPHEPELVAGASTPSAGSTRIVGIALGIVLLASGLGFLVSSSRGMRAKVQAKDSAPAQSAATNFAEPAPPAIAAPAIAPPATARPADSGFVLQVGAMTHEAYADELVKGLQQKKLPAFVFRREGDDFYRVAVGPYRQGESSEKVKADLEKQGLKPFLRAWAPEQR